MAKEPTHIKLFFIRSLRVQKAHIAGERIDEGGELMSIVRKGEEKLIARIPATDLIIAESAIEVKSSAGEHIANFKRQFADDAKAEKDREAREREEQRGKKAA